LNAAAAAAAAAAKNAHQQSSKRKSRSEGDGYGAVMQAMHKDKVARDRGGRHSEPVRIIFFFFWGGGGAGLDWLSVMWAWPSVDVFFKSDCRGVLEACEGLRANECVIGRERERWAY